MERYTLIQKLGSSQHCSVYGDSYFGYDCITQHEIVQKCVSKTATSETKEKMIIQRNSLLREIQIFKILPSNNLLLPIEHHYFQNGQPNLIYKYCLNGDLYNVVSNTGPFSEEMAKIYITKIFQSIEFCHSHNVYPIDLRMENYIFDDQLRLKLYKLSSSYVSNCRITLPYVYMKDYLGNKTYLPPEIRLEQKLWLEKSCIWSIGIILFTLLCGFPPYQEPTQQDWWYVHLGNSSKNNSFWNAHLRYHSFSNEVQSFLNDMLQKNPLNRSSIHELYQHEWLKSQSPLFSYSDIQKDIKERTQKLGKLK